jgi:hypothetical protein
MGSWEKFKKYIIKTTKIRDAVKITMMDKANKARHLNYIGMLAVVTAIATSLVKAQSSLSMESITL